MADETAVAEPEPAEPVAPPAADPEPEPFDQERAMALITKLRGEVKDAKADKRKQTELETRLREIEDAQLSEQQRVEKERDELKAEKDAWEKDREETNLRLAVYSQQQTLGIADADLAIAALNRASIVWEDGKPTNIQDVLTDLLTQKPILRGIPQAAPAPNIPSRTPRSRDSRRGHHPPVAQAPRGDQCQHRKGTNRALRISIQGQRWRPDHPAVERRHRRPHPEKGRHAVARHLRRNPAGRVRQHQLPRGLPR
jgi:hypothetical protein